MVFGIIAPEDTIHSHHCRQCHHENETDARFCSQCGTPIATSLACPACGQANEADAQFCTQCGQKIRY